jgi:hypothetical protein
MARAGPIRFFGWKRSGAIEGSRDARRAHGLLFEKKRGTAIRANTLAVPCRLIAMSPNEAGAGPAA